MKIERLIECLHLGHEIEFTINNQLYFLEPDYESIEKFGKIFYKLYRCNKNESKYLVNGTIEDILNYTFDGNNSLNNCCERFEKCSVF